MKRMEEVMTKKYIVEEERRIKEEEEWKSEEEQELKSKEWQGNEIEVDS